MRWCKIPRILKENTVKIILTIFYSSRIRILILLIGIIVVIIQTRYTCPNGEYYFWEDFGKWSFKYADENKDKIVTDEELKNFKNKFLK